MWTTNISSHIPAKGVRKTAKLQYIQRDGRAAPKIAVVIATQECAKLGVPVGIVLGTCECETNFRLGLVSKSGAVGPVQFLPQYKDDYYRYAGFTFNLETWEALKGIAGVYKKYAQWGHDRHGLEGDDCWRYAVSAHRYGQNSKTCLDMHNKRITDVEEHMKRNNLWYSEQGGAIDPAVDHTKTAKAAVNWALSKVGCPYSQPSRLKENVFDCSSLVARSYKAAGVSMKGGGLSEVPTSTKEVYCDQFELLWPETYAAIGKVMGGKSVLDKARQPGDLQFLCTQSSTTRSNRITHVTMVCDKDHIVHARGSAYGVVVTPYTLYNGKVCAVVRYNPDGPLRKGMRGVRVLALQKKLNELGARLAEDGEYGPATEKAVKKYGLD